MSKVLVVCAPQTFGRNPGMASVDLAAHALWRRRFPRHEFVFGVLYGNEGPDFPGPPCYTCFRDRRDLLEESDAVLFWGDFAHVNQYRRNVAKVLVRLGLAADEGEGTRLVRRHLYLAESPEARLDRCVLFGGTILFNSVLDDTDEEYGRDLSRLVRGARAVWMREPFSGLAVSRLRGDYRSSHVGVDCAFLLDNDDFAPAGRTAPAADRLGVFFGRTSIADEALGGFTWELAGALGLEAEWLPWGSAPFFREREEGVRAFVPGLREASVEDASLAAMEGALRGCRVVLTDTYHVCVNAWRAGVPAVCVVETAARDNTVNAGADGAWRDKRTTLYWTYDAMPYLVWGEELLDSARRRERAGFLAGVLGEPRHAEAVRERIRRHRDAAEEGLVTALKELVE